VGPHSLSIVSLTPFSLSVHPGVVNTDMQDQWEDAYPGILGMLTRNLSLSVGRSPEQGCYSALYSALSDEVVEKDYNGFYLTDPARVSMRERINAYAVAGAAG